MTRARTATVVALIAALLSGCSLLPDLPRPARSDASTSGSSTTGATASPTGGSAAGTALGLALVAPADRRPLPDLAGTTLSGSSLDLASLRGRVVVLNAWASWCEPCKAELPVLVSLARSASPDVAFVGLDVDDTAAGAEAMAAEYGITWPSVVDSSGALLARVPGVPPTAIPSTVVLDRQGRVAARVIGGVDAGVLEPVLVALAAER